MKRYFRLRRFKNLRKIRDNIMSAKNYGLAFNLLSDMPHVTMVRLTTGFSAGCEVRLVDGFIVYGCSTGINDAGEAIRKAAARTYLRIIERYL